MRTGQIGWIENCSEMLNFCPSYLLNFKSSKANSLLKCESLSYNLASKNTNLPILLKRRSSARRSNSNNIFCSRNREVIRVSCRINGACGIGHRLTVIRRAGSPEVYIIQPRCSSRFIVEIHRFEKFPAFDRKFRKRLCHNGTVQ